MRRLGRWIVYTLTVLSLLLCVAKVALWAFSYRRCVQLQCTLHREQCRIFVDRGRFGIDNEPQLRREAEQRRAFWQPPGDRMDFESQLRRLTVGEVEKRLASKDLSEDEKALLNHSLVMELDFGEKSGELPTSWSSAWSKSSAAVLPAAVLVLLGLPGLGRMRRARRRSNGLCPQCNYDLRATPNRCPECGTSSNEAPTITPSTTPPAPTS